MLIQPAAPLAPRAGLWLRLKSTWQQLQQRGIDTHAARGSASIDGRTPGPDSDLCSALQVEGPEAPAARVDAPAGWNLCRIRQLDTQEFEDLVAFVLANPRYRQETQQRPSQRADAQVLLTERPAGCAPGQKYLWGLRHGGTWVGCLEVLRGWPDARTVYIGFLMTDERRRRQGHAEAALHLLAQRSRAWPGIRRWRLAVVETQADALRFWRKAGFVPTGERLHTDAYRAPLVVMEKIVAR